MTDLQTERDMLDGYDLIMVTIREFRKSIRKYQKHPYNNACFMDVFRHMQFMQSDGAFDMLSCDVNELIDSVLAEFGLTQTDVVRRAYQHCRRIL